MVGLAGARKSGYDERTTSLWKGDLMRVVTQFSIYLINKPGVLAAVTGALAKAKVNILALALMDSGEHGALRIVCDEVDVARAVLGRTSERWTETEVIVMDLENRPGSFSGVAQRLADEHINITYAYCSGGAPGGRTTAVFKVADTKKSLKVLKPSKGEHDESDETVKTPPPGRH
jgi:hypothetical protein